MNGGWWVLADSRRARAAVVRVAALGVQRRAETFLAAGAAAAPLPLPRPFRLPGRLGRRRRRRRPGLGRVGRRKERPRRRQNRPRLLAAREQPSSDEGGVRRARSCYSLLFADLLETDFLLFRQFCTKTDSLPPCRPDETAAIHQIHHTTSGDDGDRFNRFFYYLDINFCRTLVILRFHHNGLRPPLGFRSLGSRPTSWGTLLRVDRRIERR